jgi:hypothetical protein
LHRPGKRRQPLTARSFDSKGGKNLESIDKRLPWSFLGFLLGTISLAIAIGFFYLSKREHQTDLKFYVDDEFPLVELRERFPDIKIRYKEEDIIGSEKAIKVLRLRLVNGGQTILQSFYDQELPFGLLFRNSQIIAVFPVAPSTGYLHDTLFRQGAHNEFGTGRLLLGKPIIEKGSAVSFKVYLLQDKDVQTTPVTALGKISGMDSIPVVLFDPRRASPDTPGRSTREVLIFGFAAGYAGMLALLLTAIGIALLRERIGGRSRRKRCRQFLEVNNAISEEQKRLIAGYAEGWRPFVLPTIRTLAEGGKALDISEMVRNLFPTTIPGMLLDPVGYHRLRRLLPLRWDPSMFVVSEGKISLNEENKVVLLRFLQHCNEIPVEQRAPAGGEDAAAES